MKKEFHILTNNSKIKCAKEKNIFWYGIHLNMKYFLTKANIM